MLPKKGGGALQVLASYDVEGTLFGVGTSLDPIGDGGRDALEHLWANNLYLWNTSLPRF